MLIYSTDGVLNPLHLLSLGIRVGDVACCSIVFFFGRVRLYLLLDAPRAESINETHNRIENHPVALSGDVKGLGTGGALRQACAVQLLGQARPSQARC